MQTVKTSHVLAVRPGFTAEARRICGKFLRHCILLKNHVAEDVGHRHFGCRDEIKVVYVAVIHLSLLVGKLACAVARCLVNHKRRLHFQIAALASLVEEESLESTLQTCHLADVYGESGSGDFHAEVEIDEVELLAEVPVAERVFGKVGDYTTLFHHHIV